MKKLLAYFNLFYSAGIMFAPCAASSLETFAAPDAVKQHQAIVEAVNLTVDILTKMTVQYVSNNKVEISEFDSLDQACAQLLATQDSQPTPLTDPQKAAIFIRVSEAVRNTWEGAPDRDKRRLGVVLHSMNMAVSLDDIHRFISRDHVPIYLGRLLSEYAQDAEYEIMMRKIKSNNACT